MKAVVFALLALLAFSSQAQTTANFSGVWALSTGNFVSVHQTGNVVIVAFLAVPDWGGHWEALRGTVVGSSARVQTIYGYATAVVDVKLTSPTTLTATQISCTPLTSGYTCLPNGEQVSGIKNPLRQTNGWSSLRVRTPLPLNLSNKSGWWPTCRASGHCWQEFQRLRLLGTGMYPLMGLSISLWLSLLRPAG